MKKIGQSKLSLQIRKQIDDLRLNGNIQRRHRFVGDDQLRLQRQRPGDPDPLPLPAAELVRIAVHRRRIQTHNLQEFRHAVVAFGSAGES